MYDYTFVTLVHKNCTQQFWKALQAAELTYGTKCGYLQGSHEWQTTIDSTTVRWKLFQFFCLCSSGCMYLHASSVNMLFQQMFICLQADLLHVYLVSCAFPHVLFSLTCLFNECSFVTCNLTPSFSVAKSSICYIHVEITLIIHSPGSRKMALLVRKSAVLNGFNLEGGKNSCK